ncbi:MAG: hypothetical protein ACK5V3_05445, partial [Bdellovibrionales bacterium]
MFRSISLVILCINLVQVAQAGVSKSNLNNLNCRIHVALDLNKKILSNFSNNSEPSTQKTETPDWTRFLTEEKDSLFASTKKQTIFFHRTDPSGYVVYRKSKFSKWSSQFNLIEGADTPQGDLRFFMQVAGPKISEFLGFRIFEIPGEQIEIWVPNQQRIEQKRKTLNWALKKLGFDTLAFHLAKAGLLSAQEILELSTKKIDDDTLVNFPYDDVDPRLSPHEVSFHLGALVYPKPLHQRAALVNEATANMIAKLQETKRESLIQLAEILIHERAKELDVGTASAQFGLAQLRKISGMKKYQDLAKNVPETNFSFFDESMSSRIGYYTKSHTTPAIAVVHRVLLATRIGSDLVPISNQQNPQAATNSKTMTFGKTLNIPRQDQEALHQILVEFLKAHDHQNETQP